MDGATYDRVNAVYRELREFPAEEREGRLEELCGGDASLCEKVRVFLRHGEAVSREQFLEETADLQSTRSKIPDGDFSETATSFGTYEILEEVSRGGMGVVYKARQANVNRVVALKLIKAGQLAGEEDIRRFETEAAAAAQLDHPGIVPVYDAGRHDGQPYLSMAFIEGESLMERVREAPLPPQEAAELIKSVAEAIQYAHEHGVVHRDLKPHNILVDQNGQPRVTDFGLAKNLFDDDQLTRTGQIMGTPAYMSPEQARGERDVGPLADVYSLGATLYCLLTGRPPFQASSSVETIRQVLEREPLSPRQLNPDVDRDLETVCLKCMRKDAPQRYQSAAEVTADLRCYLDGRPIKARPVGPASRIWRWCRRNPLVATATTLMLVAVGFLSGTLLQLSITLAERDHARTAESIAEKAKREKKRQLANTLAARGTLLVQRSKWREGINTLDEAIEQEYHDPTELRLQKIDALRALKKNSEAMEELAKLGLAEIPAKHRGLALIWQAECALLPGSGRDAAALYRESLQCEIPNDEREYVLGMLSETTPEALAHFQNALELNPFHLRSYGGAIATHFLLGRTDEVLPKLETFEALLPDDPLPRVLSAALIALRGDRDLADAKLQRCRNMVSDERFSKFEAIIALAASTGPEFTWSWNRRGPINLDAARLLPMADNGQLLLDSSYGLHLPPLIGNQLRRLPSILVRIFLWGDLKGGERDIRELLEVNPEGSLYTLHAGLLLGLSRFEEAAEAYELARQTPALFPKMRDEAAVGLAMSRGYLALIEHKDDEDYMRETVPFIRDAARLPTQFPLQSMILATTAQVAGEWDLAGPLIDRWEQENPSDRFNINYRRAEVEFGSGRYTRAIEAANVVLGAEIPDKALTEKRHQRVHEIIRLSRIELQKALRNTANADEGSPSNASSDR